MFSCSQCRWFDSFVLRSPSTLLEPILIASVGGLIPGVGIRHCVSTLLQVDWFCSEVRAGSFRPSPTTYPENGTNPSADLVEAVSLVICEEITWRPIFFGRWFRSTVDRISVVFTSNPKSSPGSQCQAISTGNSYPVNNCLIAAAHS